MPQCQYCGGCRNAAIVYLFLDTDLRCAELLSLTLADLNLEDGRPKVMDKGQKERIVPFGNNATRLFQRYVVHFRPKVNSTNIVFSSLDGEVLTDNAISSMLRRLAKRAGVPRLHIRLLRQTFATNCLISGGDSLTLRRILGHGTLEMTRRYVDQAASQGLVIQSWISQLATLVAPPGRRTGRHRQ